MQIESDVNLSQAEKKDLALIFVSRKRYHLTHGVYPRSVKKELEGVVNLTRQDLVPNGHEAHFVGEPVEVDDFIHVPIFSAPSEEILPSDLRSLVDGRFVVTPAAFYYPWVFPHQEPHLVIARTLENDTAEVAVYSDSALIDCFLLTPDSHPLFIAYLERLEGFKRYALGEDMGVLQDLGFQPVKMTEPLAVTMLRAALKVGKLKGWPVPVALRADPVRLAYCGIFVLLCLYGFWCFISLAQEKELAAKERKIKQEIASLKEELQPMEKLSREVDHLETVLKRLAEVHREALPASAVIGSLTEVTPDQVWLEGLRIEGNKVVIDGYAPSADRYVALLSECRSFQDVSFASAVRRDKRTGLERFSIRLCLRKTR